MALKLSIPELTGYEVTFKASSQSAGATLLTVGWVPKHGSVVPAVQDVSIAAGTVASIKGKVPAVNAARRMEIRVDLPDGTGFGTLTLDIGGNLHSEDTLSADTTWTSLVV
jgi:endoglucanase Acf2